MYTYNSPVAGAVDALGVLNEKPVLGVLDAPLRENPPVEATVLAPVLLPKERPPPVVDAGVAEAPKLKLGVVVVLEVLTLNPLVADAAEGPRENPPDGAVEAVLGV